MHRVFPIFSCLSVLIFTGCVDSSGNRITMQEWWQHHSADHRKAPAPRTDDDEVRASEAEAEPPIATVAHMDDAAPVANRSETASDTVLGPAIQADALIVNDEAIRVGDILEPITPTLEQMSRELPPDTYFQKATQIVRLQIIEAVAQHLIWRRAQRQITDELKPQLDKAVDKMEKDRINREFGGLETEYEKYLTRHGKTRAEVRERLKRTVVIDSYIRDRLLELIPVPRKNELEQYYRSHVSDFSRQERREMFLIDIPINAFLDPSRPILATDEAAAEQQARESAEQAAQALARGEDFIAVARERSRGLHTDEGGAWGLITEPADRSSPPMQGRWSAPSKRLFELQADEVSEIIHSARSFFIVKCGTIEGGQRLSFQEAQPEIVATLRKQKFLERRAAFLQEELDRSTIGSLDAFVSQVLHAVPLPEQRQSKNDDAPLGHR